MLWLIVIVIVHSDCGDLTTLFIKFTNYLASVTVITLSLMVIG